MCSVCEKLTCDKAHSRLAVNRLGAEVELYRDGDDVKLISWFWNAERLEHLDKSFP
jgi:hypothetical protein